VVVKHSVPGELPLLLQSAGSQPVYFYGEQNDPNQLSEEPELKEVLEQPYAKDQYFWVGTDAKGEGTATIQAQGNLGTGYKNAPEQKTLKLVPVDLDFIKPGTENDTPKIEIDEEKEDSEGEVVNINWDDDDESEDDIGHGKLVFKNDFDDTAPNEKEDDMIQLKLHAINAAGAKAKLKYDANFVKIWRNRNRTGEVVSESTEIAVTETQIVYLEGRKLTAAEVPTNVEMLIKNDGNENYKSGDKVSVHVATPIIFLSGVNPEISNEEASSMFEIIRSDSTLLGKRRVDNRSNTLIVKGKNQSAKVLFYSLDIVTANLTAEEALEEEFPGKLASKDKEMKVALALDGAHVVFSGHSNYGLGPNFMKVGVKTVDDFMNVSNFGIAGIVLKEKFGDVGFVNPMRDPEHGGSEFAIRESDIKDTVENKWVTFSGFNQRRFPGDASSFTRKTGDGGAADYHFVTATEWATVVGSSGDIPTLKYASLFMNSCNSGRHFGVTFNRKPYIYTKSDSYSYIQDAEELSDLDSLASSYIFIEGLILGKNFSEITIFLNKHRKFPEKSPGGNYSVSQ
jgi:hypothetical protein